MKKLLSVKHMVMFAMVMLSMIAVPKVHAYAMTESEAADYEEKYISKHDVDWLSNYTNKTITSSHAAFWELKDTNNNYQKGVLTVIGADAYATDVADIERLSEVTDLKTNKVWLSDYIDYMKTGGGCNGTKSCAKRCSQSVRDGGCKKQCALTAGTLDNACKGHMWAVTEINPVRTKYGDCGSNGIEYIFVHVKCESKYACEGMLWICLFSPVEIDHQQAIRDNGDGTHTFYCEICKTEFKTEKHKWGDWINLSSYDRVRNCTVCDAEDVESVDPPTEQGSSGYATYYPDYPTGTTVGARSIKDKLTYVPDEYGWSYPAAKTPSAGYYNSYQPSTGELKYKYFKKGVTYHPTRIWVKTIDNSAKNKYTIRAKTALFSGSTEDAGRFWAKYTITYKAGDTSGSTKAVNVPSAKDFYCHPASISPLSYGQTYTFGKDPIYESHTVWQTTTVTASTGSGMYRTGYLFQNWKNGTWGGKTWKGGEARTTLPNGNPMRSSQLTANWKNEEYTIQFNSNKPGNASHDPTTCGSIKETFDKRTNDLPTPSLTGWTFLGWYTNESGNGDGTIRLSDYENQNWTFDPKPTTGENSTIQAYAHWIANTYTVNLFMNKPSISIQELCKVQGNTFASGGTAWTWNNAGYYSSTFTYDSGSYLPAPGDVYSMTGWTVTNGWWWYRNDSTEPYVSNEIGMGYKNWNLTAVNGGVVAVYEGWRDNDPNTSGETDSNYSDPDDGDYVKDIKLRAVGQKRNRWYATATKDRLNEADPYIPYSWSAGDGTIYKWTTRWINEDVDLTLWAQDYGTGIANIRIAVDQYPSESSKAMNAWYTGRDNQSDRILSMKETDIYNGTSVFHGWAEDYSNKNGKADGGAVSTTLPVTIKIDKNAPKKVYTTRTTGTFDAPLSGDGNPYVGNPAYDDYKYTGAIVEDSEMETLFTATIDDRDNTLYNNCDVAGIASVYVDVWDAEDVSVIKSYTMHIDTGKAYLVNADGDAYAYGNYYVRANLYKDFPNASNLYYKIKCADKAGNVRTLYDSSTDTTGSDYPLDTSDNNYKPLPTPNDDNTRDENTGVTIRNITIQSWITRDDISEEASNATVTDKNGITKRVPVADNYFLGGQNGTMHIDTYGYVDDVEIRFPTEAGHGTTLTLHEITYSTTLGDILLAAWYDQKRGLATGKLDALVCFNDDGTQTALNATETDLRYTTEESGVAKNSTKDLPTFSGNGGCERYYTYQFRMPLYIDEVLTKAGSWSYDHQVYDMRTFETVETARKYHSGSSQTTSAIARSKSYAVCGTVGNDDTKLTDTFHTFLYW